MKKKKIVFINNHFQYSDGTVRALIGLVNNLDPEKFDITIKPLYICDRQLAKELRADIKLEKCFGFYFKGFNKLVNLFSAKYWYKRFINEKYDIEVAFQCDLPTKMVGASTNKYAVHTEWMHCYDLWPQQYKIADQVVCVSKYCENKCRKEMKGNVNVTHCYNIIDDSVICNMAKEPISNDIDFSKQGKPLFITVGRLSKEKGYIRLVQIMKDLHDENFDFSLVIVGGGYEKPLIKKAINEYGLSNKIFMVGEKHNPHNITMQADCFICSSFDEGFSTACTEAAILGVPIITTNVPGGEEIIETCECGILTDIDDESLKSGIRKVLQNQTILKEWKNKMSLTKERFFLKNRVKELNILFDSLYDKSIRKNKI